MSNRGGMSTLGEKIQSVASPRGWTFLTNHAHVLLVVARDPSTRVRDIAAIVGITERAALAILDDLEDEGYLVRTKVGRRNHYTVNPAGRFRHPIGASGCVGDLLTLFTPADPPA